MSDGGGESGRERSLQQNVSSSSNKRVKYACDEFGRAVAKVAVAQICECEGYQGFQQSALETLSNVGVRYIQNLGKSAKFHADVAGRSECNIFDIVQGLEDFGAVQGFPGASDIDRCPASSGTVKELIQYVSESEEFPFAYDVPQFPIVKDRKLAPNFSQVTGESPSCHIPSWLPAFPHPLAFISPPDKVGSDENPEQKDKVEDHKKHREAHPMLSLHQRMSHNGLEGSSSDALNSSMAGRSAGTNPFLAAPLKCGEVEVSPVVFPKKQLHDTSQEKNIANHIQEEYHLPEMAIPAPTANQLENHLHASRDDKATSQGKQKAAVKFSLRISKKYRISNIDGSDEENCVDAITPQFRKAQNDERKKDDKKWIADHNLIGGMENPEEVAE